MSEEQAKKQERIRKEERQLFRSFLKRLGPDVWTELLHGASSSPKFTSSCVLLFDGTLDRNVMIAGLKTFVQTHGDVSFPEPDSAGKLKCFDDMKEWFEKPTTDKRYRYTELDRFLQVLDQHWEAVEKFVLSAENLKDYFPNDIVVEFENIGREQRLMELHNRCSKVWIGMLEDADELHALVESFHQSMKHLGVYKPAESVDEASQPAAVAISGSEDTGHDGGE